MMLYCATFKNTTVMPCLEGIGGAWVGNKPIPEALTLGSYLCPIFQAPQFQAEVWYKTGIYCGSLPNHFGHFLLEGLARLWYAVENSSLPLIWTSSLSYKQWQQEILDIVKVQNKPIFIDKPCSIEVLHVPTPGYILDKLFDERYAKIIGRYESRAPIKGKKNYISRTKVGGGGYENEEEIEKLLFNNGWNIVHPQELSVARQCYEFSSAEIVLGIESSAFHSLILQNNIKSKIVTLSRMGGFNYQIVPLIKKLITLKYI